MSTPVSSIAFCSGVGLNSKYEHTFYFGSLGEQRTYFNSKAVKGVVPLTYLRKKMDIRAPIPFDTARKYDYCYFRNNDDKVWYYFINDIEYINDNTTEFKLELDVMQTYMFDYELLPSFVEREHAELDDIGRHTMDEGLDPGDYVVTQTTDATALRELVVLVASTFDPEKTTGKDHVVRQLGHEYAGIWSGLHISAVPKEKWNAMATKLNTFDEEGISEGIVALWLSPLAFVALDANTESWTSSTTFKTVGGLRDHFQEFTPVWKLNNYTPRNNKLLTYPYNMLYVTNNSGAAASFKYERFGDINHPNFKFVGTPAPDGLAKVYPLNYLGAQHNYDSGLTLGNYPQCAWTQDVYKLWLAQNQNQQALTIGSGVLQLAAGTAMAVGAVASAGTLAPLMGTGAVGSIASGLSTIAGTYAQRQDREIQPPQSKGSQSANVNISAGFQTFTFMQKTITYEHAKRLDTFFDKYGYKVARVKRPNIAVRKNWTYTKTVGCKIRGSFATADVRAIENIYDNGITFWCNPANLGDYTVDNSCLW